MGTAAEEVRAVQKSRGLVAARGRLPVSRYRGMANTVRKSAEIDGLYKQQPSNEHEGLFIYFVFACKAFAGLHSKF